MSKTCNNLGGLSWVVFLTQEHLKLWLPQQRILINSGSITVRLTSYLDGSDLTRQVNLLLFTVRKAAESKQVKYKVSCTVILPLLMRIVWSRLASARYIHNPAFYVAVNNSFSSSFRDLLGQDTLIIELTFLETI